MRATGRSGAGKRSPGPSGGAGAWQAARRPAAPKRKAPTGQRFTQPTWPRARLEEEGEDHGEPLEGLEVLPGAALLHVFESVEPPVLRRGTGFHEGRRGGQEDAASPGGARPAAVRALARPRTLAPLGGGSREKPLRGRRCRDGCWHTARI